MCSLTCARNPFLSCFYCSELSCLGSACFRDKFKYRWSRFIAINKGSDLNLLKYIFKYFYHELAAFQSHQRICVGRHLAIKLFLFYSFPCQIELILQCCWVKMKVSCELLLTLFNMRSSNGFPVWPKTQTIRKIKQETPNYFSIFKFGIKPALIFLNKKYMVVETKTL